MAIETSQPFAAGSTNSQDADETAVLFPAFADAAFLRTCGSDLLAVQRISLNQPLKWNIGRPFQTDLLRCQVGPFTPYYQRKIIAQIVFLASFALTANMVFHQTLIDRPSRNETQK